MKRYITTDKHPELKEGVILEFNEEFVKQWHTKHSQFSLSEVEAWKVEGWIKEVQEPKWTDQDMIDFGERARDYNHHPYSVQDLLETFEETR